MPTQSADRTKRSDTSRGIAATESDHNGAASSSTRTPRVVIVHDYLTQRGGAERVVLAMLRALPDSRLVTSVYEPGQTFPAFRDYEVETLWPNRVVAFRRDPRLALPLLGSAFSRHVVRDADVVLCSSSGWAHAVATELPKLVYCYTPPRWLYQPDDYFLHLPGWTRRAIQGGLEGQRHRDQRWAGTADRYFAISTVVRDRVAAAYGIDATVLHPPAGVYPDGDVDPVAGIEPGFFLVVGRRRSYKNLGAVISAFAGRPHDRLVVVGDLTRSERREMAPNVTDVHSLSDAQLRWLYANAEALIAIAREDFGLTPVEAYQFGKPVVALRAGGYLDTVIEGVTGVFADSDTVDGIRSAVSRLSEGGYDPAGIAAQATRFAERSFAAQISEVVRSAAIGS